MKPKKLTPREEYEQGMLALLREGRAAEYDAMALHIPSLSDPDASGPSGTAPVGDELPPLGLFDLLIRTAPQWKKPTTNTGGAGAVYAGEDPLPR